MGIISTIAILLTLNRLGGGGGAFGTLPVQKYRAQKKSGL